MDLDKNYLDNQFSERCELFIELLQKWGKVHNLTGNLDTNHIKENIYDSIYPLEFINPNYKVIADIGTGAGFPGLILAMAQADKTYYLIEPRAKRVAFLNFVKNSLGLNNITVLSNRVENIEDLKVDLITSRAVTNTNLLLTLTKNIAKEDSSYLFYKGSLLEEELEEVKLNTNYKIINRKDRNYLYIKGEK